MEYIIIISILACVALYVIISFIINDKKIKANSFKGKQAKAIKDYKTSFKFNNQLYIKKDKLVTNNELKYYYIIKKAFKNYIVIPQVNLAAIIDKKTTYRNELFRNIDFGIFNKDFKLIMLIEINDKTHLNNARIDRDIKVNEILKGLNIELLTLWTDSDKTKAEIIRKVKKFRKYAK